VDQNPYLCEPDQCNKKKNKKNNSIVTPLVASVGGVFVLLVVVAAILWTAKRRKAKGDSTIVNIRYFYRYFSRQIQPCPVSFLKNWCMTFNSFDGRKGSE